MMFSMFTDLLLILSLLALLFSISAGTYIFISYCCPDYDFENRVAVSIEQQKCLMSVAANMAGVQMPAMPPMPGAVPPGGIGVHTLQSVEVSPPPPTTTQPSGVSASTAGSNSIHNTTTTSSTAVTNNSNGSSVKVG